MYDPVEEVCYDQRRASIHYEDGSRSPTDTDTYTRSVYESQLNFMRAHFQIGKEFPKADFMSSTNSSKRNAFSHMETIEENIPLFEWFEENILQICTLTQRSWETTTRGEVYTKYPPLEEVEFDNYY